MRLPFWFTAGPGPADARFVIGLLLVIFGVFEIWAVSTGGWTISDEWWDWKAGRPWLTFILAALLFIIWGHLSFEWGRLKN